MNDTFCSLPWVGLDVSPQGEFKPCCKYQHTIATDIVEYFNSDELKNLQNDFTNGRKPDGCHRCWQDEDVGIASKRLIDLEYTFQNRHPALDKLKIVSMPFGNTCNLACRICNSSSSSKWAQEAIALQKFIPEIPVAFHKKFYKDDEFMSKLASLSNEAVLFEFPGGEPFLTGLKEHIAFLVELIKGTPQDLKLHYITNTTIMPQPELWALWKNFKNVDIQLSIDGVGEQFEYNRWPALWADCLQNIKQYQTEQKKYDNIQLSISHTVSIFTVMYLPKFLDWCDTQELPSPYLGLLTKPAHYSIAAIPEKAAAAIANLPEFQKSQLLPIKASLFGKRNDCFDKFVNYVTIIDRHRKQNFPSTFPELYQLLKDYFNA